jgi:hypothetical protein
MVKPQTIIKVGGVFIFIIWLFSVSVFVSHPRLNIPGVHYVFLTPSGEKCYSWIRFKIPLSDLEGAMCVGHAIELTRPYNLKSMSIDPCNPDGCGVFSPDTGERREPQVIIKDLMRK